MNESLGDFLLKKMEENGDDEDYENDGDDEPTQEYNNDYEDAINDDLNDESYYGKYAGDVLDDDEDNNNKKEIKLKSKYIGEIGEIFAYNYFDNLFRINNIRNYKILHHNNNNEDFDLEVSINGKSYKFEVKFSTKEKTCFKHIHFNNNFDFLFLIWKSSNEEIYFAILLKNEARKYAFPENANREEDDFEICTTEIFNEDNKEFLNRLSKFLDLNEDLEDLEDDEKLELLEDAKEQLMKNPNALENGFSGETYQQWTYEYLSNYVDDVDLMPKGYKYDIKYKEKGIEVKYSSLNEEDLSFKFAHIKPDNFDFIFLIGFDKENKKFYFSIKTRDEVVKIKKELAESDDFYSQNGFELHVGKDSKVNFINDFYFEDFNNYIENH